MSNRSINSSRSTAPAPALAQNLFEQLQAAKLDLARAVDVPLLFPATYSQKALHFVQMFQPDGVAYHIPFEYKFEQAIDPIALRIALEVIVQRHEILRTRYRLVDDELMQEVLPQIELPHTHVQAQHLCDEEVQQQCYEWARKPFDLSCGPLFRSTLLERSPHEFTWFICFHHISFDHLAIWQFSRELNLAYQRALINPSAINRARAPLNLADYACWQAEHQRSSQLQDKLVFWRELIQDPAVFLDLPTDFTRPALASGQGRDIWFRLSPRSSELVQQISRQFQVSRYILTMTQYAVLMYRLSGTPTFLLGTPFANRNDQAELQNVLGCFINTLPVPFDFSDNPSFRQLLERTNRHFLKIFERQDVAFELIIETVQPPRDTSYSPLFQSVFMYQDPPMEIVLGEAKAQNRRLHNGSSKFDLTMWLWDEPGAVCGTIEYAQDLFEHSTVAQFVHLFETIVTTTCEQSNCPVNELLLVDTRNIEQFCLAGPKQARPAVGLHQLIADQANQAGRTLAILCEDRQLSYQQLWQACCQIAQELNALGTEPGGYIGVCLPRSEWMLIACLGVMQSGCAYIPLDPDYPIDRLQYMIGHSGMQAVIIDHHTQALLAPFTTKLHTLNLDQRKPAMTTNSTPSQAALPVEPEQAAYVIYTSGSTGRPKGVVIPHRAVVNFQLSVQRKPGFSSNDQLLALTTLSFDISILELFLPLVSGGRVDILPSQAAKDPQLLIERIASTKPSMIQATPATWRMLIQSGWQGSERPKILVGGEALPEDLVAELVSRSSELWNMYGPTETTIWSTCEQIRTASCAIRIGRPLANTQCLIMNEAGQPLPAGIPGELYIGGSGVALGYLNQPELSADRFINTEFLAGRLYRTGDLVTRQVDGRLKYHRRLDHQVKIRGFRIELGEIEQVLLRHDQIRAGAVVVQGEGLGKRLVAYYVASAQQILSSMQVRKHLATSLPKHMIPELFVALETLPLTPSKKIDRKALSTRQIEQTGQSAGQQPTTSSELYYAKLWQTILTVPSPTVLDNFFDIGGNSLLSLRVVAAAKRDHDIAIPPNALVLNNLAQLADRFPVPMSARTSESAAPAATVSDSQPEQPVATSQSKWYSALLKPFR